MFISRKVGPAGRRTLQCAVKTDLPAKLAHSSNQAILFFFSHVNCSPSFEGNVGKVVLPRVARVGE